MLQGVDAVYYNGVSTEGTAVICGLARRSKQSVDAFMYIKVRDTISTTVIGIVQNPEVTAQSLRRRQETSELLGGVRLAANICYQKRPLLR